MDNDAFIELAGRIEALSRVVLHMAAVLEERGIMDGPRFAEGLRSSLRPEPDADQVLHVARERLHELANGLDAARETRRSRARSEGSRDSHET